MVCTEFSRLQQGFKYENNTGLCGNGFSTLQICTESDLMSQNGPKPFSAGLTPDNTTVSSELNPKCSKLHCNRNSLNLSSVVAIATVVAFIAVSLVAGLFTLAWYRYRNSRKSTESIKQNGPLKNESLQRSPSSLISIEYNACWDPLANEKAVSQSFQFNLEEVECATQYFSEANLLGNRGGRFGFTTSYKGTLRDGTNVVVKRINKTSCKQEEAEFLKGLKLVLGLKHEIVVGVRGFCCSRGRGECFLVYDFVPNGSLVRYLDLDGEKDGCVIDWSTRVSIIKGVAKGKLFSSFFFQHKMLSHATN
jgi:Protein tyrosine and serine/threonine kinase